MGIRPSNTCELILQDVVVPEANRVGREGEGFRIAMNTLDSARPFVGAVSVGLAQAALDCAVKYAKERKQFGSADRFLPNDPGYDRRYGNESRDCTSDGLQSMLDA